MAINAMSEQCPLRRKAYQATKNGEAIVWEDEGLPESCRICAREALQKADVQLHLEDKEVTLDAEGEPDCHWGMISKEGNSRLIVMDVHIEDSGRQVFTRTYPRVICPYPTGSISRQQINVPPNPYL
jgi:hypothetical protein